LVNILLARWLPPKEYGAFAVALSVFYLLAGFHTALLTKPMMVFGAGKYREHFYKYLGMLFYAHWGISLLIAGGLSIAAFVMKHLSSLVMAKALAGLALASPFLLFLWFTRRACYVPMRPKWAVVGSGLNFLFILVGIFLLWWEKLFTSFSGLMLLGITAGMASFFLIFVKLRPLLHSFTGNPTIRMVIYDHWSYGKWVVLESFVYLASAQLWILLIPIILGLQQSAAIVAIRNLYRPVNFFMQAIGVVLLPTIAFWINRKDEKQKLYFKVLIFATISALFVGIYGLILTIFAKSLLHFLYKGHYDQYWLLVPLFGGVAVFTVGLHYLLLALKAKAIVRPLPFIWGAMTIINVLFSIPLMLKFDVYGAVAGYLFSYIFAFFVGFLIFKKHFSVKIKT